MPSVRIVIASNAKRTTKSVVVIPLSDADAFETIIELAKKKLRVKGKRVFYYNGLELLQAELKIRDVVNDE